MPDVILAVGDMAGPAADNAGSVHTAALTTSLIAANPGATLLVLGDNAYTDGTQEDYANFSAPIWGVQSIAGCVRACPGNHGLSARLSASTRKRKSRLKTSRLFWKDCGMVC